MKTNNETPVEAVAEKAEKTPKGRRHRMNCELIQSMLLDYLNKELDAVRSDLVWKHIKKCPDCEVEAREMEATLAILRSASADRAGVPERLSEKQRARIIHALTHPLIHWIERNHVIASLAVATIIVLGALFYFKWLLKDEGKATPIPPSFTISLDPNRSPVEEQVVPTNPPGSKVDGDTNNVAPMEGKSADVPGDGSSG